MAKSTIMASGRLRSNSANAAPSSLTTAASGLRDRAVDLTQSQTGPLPYFLRDKTIERYRRILLAIGDQLMIDRTKEMIADLETQKAALHPEQAP